MSTFSKILIANRGEIAVRISRTAQAMGYRTVAVYSEADAESLHVKVADQAVCIGPAAVGESYLRIDKIIAAAQQTGADAVHPGYGFLAENAEFARACADAGITFIGPDPEVIDLMGNKRAAKERMLEAGVPCVPGFQGRQLSDEELIERAADIGFPLMVKAAAGGGGRGIRLIFEGQSLREAIASARSEARSAFGDDELILEKAITNPRHIEIQVFADRHGKAVYLGERDCSIQRRHQKVVEEAPSPAVNEDLRKRMGEAAVAVAKAVDYVGAGTVEFLLDDQGEFYFLEMNTRLQVEHPVTELVTGLDLVALQIRVAGGHPLDLCQEQVKLQGHAIEVRLYAEDPTTNFLPQSGKVIAWEPPCGEGVRVDHCLIAGQEVSSHYDPMLAKVIAFGDDREEARRRLVRAIEDCVFLGVKSNQGFLARVLAHKEFASGVATTAFIERHFPVEELSSREPSAEIQTLAAALFHQASSESAQGNAALRNWQSANPCRLSNKLLCGGEEYPLLLSSSAPSRYEVQVGETLIETVLLGQVGNKVRFACNGVQGNAFCVLAGGKLFLNHSGEQFQLEDISLDCGEAAGGGGQGKLHAAMDGRIVAIHVEAGQLVEMGQTLLVMEAMKIEHVVKADINGVVQPLLVQCGQQVSANQLLVEVVAA